jgi:hypothetical protein
MWVILVAVSRYNRHDAIPLERSRSLSQTSSWSHTRGQTLVVKHSPALDVSFECKDEMHAMVLTCDQVLVQGCYLGLRLTAEPTAVSL